MKKPSTQSNFEQTATDAEPARSPQFGSEPGPSGGSDLASISTSPWQRERALTLHRICQRIQARIAKGQSRSKAIRTFSRRWNGKPFKVNSARRYALSAGRLYQHYRKWRLTGENPSAFRLHYFPSNRRIPAPVLVRFVELCASREFPSLRAAWQMFCRRGPGNVRNPKLGYHSLRWNLPRAGFAALKGQWKTLRQAERQIQMLRLEYTAKIRASVPERLPRRRTKREADFQI